MSEPLILTTTSTVNDGNLNAVKTLSTRFAEQIEAAATGLLAFCFYLSDDATAVSNIQVHRDAAAADAYLPLAQRLIQEALQYTKTLSIDVYGTPGPALQQVLRANAEQGVQVRITSRHVSGFTRPGSA